MGGIKYKNSNYQIALIAFGIAISIAYATGIELALEQYS